MSFASAGASLLLDAPSIAGTWLDDVRRSLSDSSLGCKWVFVERPGESSFPGFGKLTP